MKLKTLKLQLGNLPDSLDETDVYIKIKHGDNSPSDRYLIDGVLYRIGDKYEVTILGYDNN